jgi:outer membrane receptor protein involved in Fe transport
MNHSLAFRSLRSLRTGTLIMACFATLAGGQATGIVEGTVTLGGNNLPLSDAQISLVGTSRGARTDEAGRFRIPGVTAGSYQLRAQRIGYASQSKPVTVVAGQTVSVAFSLREAALSLEALVVTGTAAESRKKEIGNATAAIDVKSLAMEPVKNTQDILVGRAPGVTVLSNSGQPGAGGTIRLRGTNSVTQSNSPIVYVDGVRIYSDGGPVTPNARQSTLAINEIKADDIERVEIVKGAAATTLYGTEASGGVIQIFTRKGTAGAPRWNLDITGGQNFMGHVGPSSDPTGLFLNKCRGPELHDAFNTPFVDPTCPSSGTWLERGNTQKLSLGVRGGGEAMTYFLSGNYNNEEGVVRTNSAKDGGTRGNFSFTPARNLSIAVNTSYNRKIIHWLPDGNLANGFTLNVMRGPSNNFKGGKGECADVASGTTCVTNGYVLDLASTNNADHFILGSTLQWSPITPLTNRFAIGFDYNNNDIKSIIPFGFLNNPLGSINSSNWNHTKLSLDYAGSYQNSLRAGSLASTFSWGGQLFDDREHFTGVTGVEFSGPGDPTLASAARVTLGRDDRPRVVTAGFFLQELVGWRDRLFLTGGLRVDGNSAFGRSFGLQQYPKVSAAYVISDESFWPTRYIPTLKLRAAIGESGKAPGAFDAVRTWDPVAGDEGKPGVTVAQVGDSTLGPERTRETELGFDMSGPGDRVTLETTVFRTRTYDALIGVTLPPSLGFSRSQLQNVGTLQNEGVELQLNTALLRNSLIEWNARFNATWLRNEAIDLGDLTVIPTGLGSSVRSGYVNSGLLALCTGATPSPICPKITSADSAPRRMPVPALYGAKVLNADSLANPIIVTDQYIGPVYPTRIFGLGTQVTLRRNLTLDVQADYAGGSYVTNFIGYQNALRNVWYPCYEAQQALRAGGTAVAKYTALERARCAIDRTIANSDFWAAKTDFVKLRSVSLAWNVPSRFVRGARTATLVVNGRNLWKWTDFDGADPESNDASDAGTGLGRREYYQLPPYKSISLSIKTTF